MNHKRMHENLHIFNLVVYYKRVYTVREIVKLAHEQTCIICRSNNDPPLQPRHTFLVSRAPASAPALVLRPNARHITHAIEDTDALDMAGLGEEVEAT